MTPSGHPDARAFAADRLLEGERMALAVAAAPLALLLTQIGTIAGAQDWVKGLATVSALCFVYCCVWQVHIVSYATYWLAAERLGNAGAGLAGGGLIREFRVAETFTEQGLIRLIRRSRLHYTVAYWAGGLCGLGAAAGVVWS